MQKNLDKKISTGLLVLGASFSQFADAVQVRKCPEKLLVIAQHFDPNPTATIHGLYGESKVSSEELKGYQYLENQFFELAVTLEKDNFKNGKCHYLAGKSGKATLRGTDKQPYLSIKLNDITVEGALEGYSKKGLVEFTYHQVFSRVDDQDFLNRAAFGQFIYIDIINMTMDYQDEK